VKKEKEIFAKSWDEIYLSPSVLERIVRASLDSCGLENVGISVFWRTAQAQSWKRETETEKIKCSKS
jgi:hypothetical protein